MATREPPIFFKETKLNLESSSPAFVVDVNLPSIVNPPKNRRQVNGSTRRNIDNDTLRTPNCATASAIYHRKHNHYPRSFLWRVLEDNSVLSLRTIDVCKPDKVSDTNLIINFHFPHAIRPSCVALSDPLDHDALDIFVLDEAGQLYTLFLRPDSFRKRSFVEGGLGDACKIVTLNAFHKFKTPYRLIAVDSDRLMVTLTDGGHIRLDRNKSHTG
jgi:nuclear pore complex protein Nup160